MMLLVLLCRAGTSRLAAHHHISFGKAGPLRQNIKRWERPLPGWVTLNTDASSPVSSPPASLQVQLGGEVSTGEKDTAGHSRPNSVNV